MHNVQQSVLRWIRSVIRGTAETTRFIETSACAEFRFTYLSIIYTFGRAFKLRHNERLFLVAEKHTGLYNVLFLIRHYYVHQDTLWKQLFGRKAFDIMDE